MNKLAGNNPNLIKQPSQCCIYCGKSYKKKTNLEKHTILCELINKSKRGISSVDDEESIPSQKKMFHMLLELGSKFNKLEEKVEEMNKWVVKKKMKINVIEWLNTNMKPDIKFCNLIEKIIILEEDVKNILEKSFLDTLNHIFSRNIYNFEEGNPIFAFIHKPNNFYIYENEDEKWIELTKENLMKFLNKVHMKLLRCYSEFKKINKDKMMNDETFSLLCDKTTIKLMNVDFRQENILGKVKTNMYLRMKKDITGMVEYEFEF